MNYKNIISQMTLEEKAAFLSGKNEWLTWDFPRLSVPSLVFSDGPSGVRRQDGAGDHLGLNPSLPATCFPSAATMANSWDTSLGEEIGRALGEEAKSLGVNVLLGPGLNMKRSPLCGRNFEYFSEDPYLAGKLAAAYIRGIQGNNVAACPKHFAVNNQELRRMAMNSVLDERTLREIYLTAFEITVKEGKPKAIMSSYNEVNGAYANENVYLLQEILRDDWGFDGFVVTDWGGSNEHVKGVAAGSDLEMPSPGFDSARQLIKAVEDGSIQESKIDTCVERLLKATLSLTVHDKEKENSDFEADHHTLARKAAGECTVLLKNEDEILPLAGKRKIAIIGQFASNPRYQGSGSSQVNATFVEKISEAILKYPLDVVGISAGYDDGKKKENEKDALRKEAILLAQKADVVLYFFGLDDISESEGQDREHMRIPQNQISLLEELAGVNTNIVGILSGGAPIEMDWEKYCKGILHGYLTGQAGAGAILDILIGKINPSGKLAETYPLCYKDTPVYHYYPSRERNAEYREGPYIGYRYYDTAGIPVRYPFGYGLSYTSFAYRDLKIEKEKISFTVTNTGKRNGAEIAQLYVSLPDAKVFRPQKELKGFAKVFLKAGESKRIEIFFDDKTFRYWNVKTGRWEAEDGEYKILVGASSKDIRLEGYLRLAEDVGEFMLPITTEFPYDRAKLPSYYTGKVQDVADEEFSSLYGKPIPDGSWSGELGLNDALCQMYYAKSRLARFVWKCLTAMKEKSEAQNKPDLNILFVYNLPFRGIAKMSEGMVSMEMAEGFVAVANGHFLHGMKKVIGGFFRNRRENKRFREKITERNPLPERRKDE